MARYKLEAWEEGWKEGLYSKRRIVDILVDADSEKEAIDNAKELVERSYYKVVSISE